MKGAINPKVCWGIHCTTGVLILGKCAQTLTPRFLNFPVKPRGLLLDRHLRRAKPHVT